MFRFTIRDVLWLMVVVGLGVALWIERSRPWRGRSEAAFRALNEAEMNPSWIGDNSILVYPLGGKTGERYPKIYPANP